MIRPRKTNCDAPPAEADAGERDDPSPTGISLGYMEGVLGFHLWLAQSIFERDLAPRLAGIDLTSRQCALLELIGANPGTSQVALAGLLGTDRATMMGLVDRLEARSFVERRRSRTDRRRQELYVTAEGRDVLARAEERMVQNEAQFGENLFSAEERLQLTLLLKRIHAGRPGETAAGKPD